jgi:hypothetical protein
MKTLNFRKYLRLFALFTLCAGMATGAIAQNKVVQFPVGLKWESMHYTSFNFQPDEGTLDPKIKAAVYILWKSKLDAMKIDSEKQKQEPHPAFVLTSSPYRGNFIFSMIFSAIENCVPPGNGSGMVDMYALCSMSIFQANAAPVMVKEISNMCFLHSNDSDNPAAKNHTEFSFHEASRTAYFRVIQYGKEVPVCNRTVRL